MKTSASSKSENPNLEQTRIYFAEVQTSPVSAACKAVIDG
jgi:hypothetical protein